MSPFSSFDIIRGQSRGIDKGGLMSLFKKSKQDESGQVSTIKTVGKFKGIVEIEDNLDKKEYYINKKKIINELIDKVGIISMGKLKRNIEIDLD